MRATSIADVDALKVQHSQDERGSSTQWGRRLLGDRILAVHNPLRGTLRGLHFQQPSKGKIVICTAGAIFDVLVDLREYSPTHMQWTEIVLHPGDAIVVPPGIAHGYLTLEPHTSLVYLLEGLTSDDCGVRWDDPKLAIDWPFAPEVVSERDRAWGLL